MPRWEKVLWKEQPYPDNYVDDTFLNSLVRPPCPSEARILRVVALRAHPACSAHRCR
jgi:phosphatidylinositol glycan class C protein